MASRTPDDTSSSTSHSRYRRVARTVLMLSALLAGLHLLVATPHFVVRLLRGSPVETFDGIDNFAVVDETVWRGSAPSTEAYAALAEAGVVTVVDLRAEADPDGTRESASAAGLSWVHVPIRDGQTPTAIQVATVTAIIESADGPVFVHCQAGVGRTGSLIAALSVADGGSPGGALMEALRFGPISLEQQVFILRSQPQQTAASLLPVKAASRLIDSPRRMWSRLTG